MLRPGETPMEPIHRRPKSRKATPSPKASDSRAMSRMISGSRLAGGKDVVDTGQMTGVSANEAAPTPSVTRDHFNQAFIAFLLTDHEPASARYNLQRRQFHERVVLSIGMASRSYR